MYNRDLPHLDTEQSSPVKKKIKLDSPEKKRSCNQPKTEESSDSENEVPQSRSPRLQRSQKGHAKFINSLREADSYQPKQPPVISKADPVDSKENILISPRNKFAVIGQVKKSRFDVNATKEVKSRYFKNSQLLQ